MRANPVDLIGGFYADDTLPWSCQDTVNWLPVMAEVGGTRTPSKLATPPGLKPYQNIGTGPIRGMHDLEGGRFIVSGRYLYQINNAGVGVRIGVIPGVGRVSMTHNQFKTGYQLLVENGQGGGGYVYDSNTQAFGRITDEGYPGSISSDYLDSYLLGVEPQGRYWFHSNLADATDYNTLDRYESEASPDKIVGLAVSQLEVVVFNQRTIEFFYNAGGATGTFQNRRQSITRGCASRHTIAKLDNTLFWLGDDGIVYRLEGYSARPVSTGPMHRAFAGKNWSEAFAQVWEDRGFKVYYLTFPDGMTFGYDVVSGLWTRRESFGLNRWRLSHIVKWGDKWYGGDFQDGRNWELDWDYQLEGDQPIIAERVSPDLADDQSELIIPNAELIFDTGQGPETLPKAFPTQPSIPTLYGVLPPAFVGQPYLYQVPLEGGTAPFNFEVVSGQLPVGFSLDAADGVISGSSATAFGEDLVIRVTDSNSLRDQKSYRLVNVGAIDTYTEQPFGVSSNDYVIPAPAGTAAGDLLIVALGYAQPNLPAGTPVMSSPGWSLVYDSRNASSSIYQAYTKVATGDDTLTISTPSVAVGHAHVMFRVPKGQYRAPSAALSSVSVSAVPVEAPSRATGFGTQYVLGAILMPAAVSGTTPVENGFPFSLGNSKKYLGVSNRSVNPAGCYEARQDDLISGLWQLSGAATAGNNGRALTFQVPI